MTVDHRRLIEMPVIESKVEYFYPASEPDRRDAIAHLEAFGLMWVSTAIVEGRERMKFCKLSHEPSDPSPVRYYTKPQYPDLAPPKPRTTKISYAGDDTKGNRKAWHK